MTVAILLTLLQEGAYRARVTIEERASVGDGTARTTGTAIVRPGEAVVATLAGRRVSLHRSADPPAPEIQPLALWTLSSSDLEERFEIEPESIPEERALPDRATGDPVRARRGGRSLATVVESSGDWAVFRLTPRGEAKRTLMIRIWREIPSGRLARIEAATATHHTTCVLDQAEELGAREGRK